MALPNLKYVSLHVRINFLHHDISTAMVTEGKKYMPIYILF